MSSSGSNKKKVPAQQAKHVHYPFWFGGSASCFAATVTHPLDLSEFRDHYRKFLGYQLICLKSRFLLPVTPSRFGIPNSPQQVRLQTRAPGGPKGMLGTFSHILRTNGFLGLYSGVSLPSHNLNPLSHYQKLTPYRTPRFPPLSSAN